MANNDYGMVVFHVLDKLHRSLKGGYAIHLEDLMADTKTFPIDERYWRAVLTDLIGEGYIDGIVAFRRMGGYAFKEDPDGIRLTARGAEYLDNNSLMAKARDAIGPVLDIASLVVK